MPRFADSKEIVANEDVEPIDVIFEKYMKEQQSLSSIGEHHPDTVDTLGRNQ